MWIKKNCNDYWHWNWLWKSDFGPFWQLVIEYKNFFWRYVLIFGNNLSNLVSLSWKLDNPYYHRGDGCKVKGGIIGQVMQPHHRSPPGAAPAHYIIFYFRWQFSGKCAYGSTDYCHLLRIVTRVAAEMSPLSNLRQTTPLFPCRRCHALCVENDFTRTFLGKQDVEVRFEVNFMLRIWQ